MTTKQFEFVDWLHGLQVAKPVPKSSTRWWNKCENILLQLYCQATVCGSHIDKALLLRLQMLYCFRSLIWCGMACFHLVAAILGYFVTPSNCGWGLVLKTVVGTLLCCYCNEKIKTLFLMWPRSAAARRSGTWTRGLRGGGRFRGVWKSWKWRPTGRRQGGDWKQQCYLIDRVLTGSDNNHCI